MGAIVVNAAGTRDADEWGYSPTLATRRAPDHTAAMALRNTRFALLPGFVAALALAGCELSLGLGIGPDDDPPSVSLAAAPQEAAPGERIGLVAAADDDYVVVEVQFFRVDGGGNTLLGRDTSSPYALETNLPAGAAAEVRYFARAVDDAGQEGESQAVVVTVQ
jgi:hypothetical protein